MQVLALPSDRSVAELAPLLADWDSPKFLALLRSLAGQATASRCVADAAWRALTLYRCFLGVRRPAAIRLQCLGCARMASGAANLAKAGGCATN